MKRFKFGTYFVLLGYMLIGHAFAEEIDRVKDVHEKVRAIVTDLIPMARINTTYGASTRSIDKDQRIRISDFSFLMSGVKTPVVEADEEGFVEMFAGFLNGVEAWPEFQDVGPMSTYRSYTFKKHARAARYDIIPGISFGFSKGEIRYFHLSLDFINMENNMCLVKCNLMVNIPPPTTHAIKLVNPEMTVRKLDEGKYEHVFSFDLKNVTDKPLKIVTDGYSRSISSSISQKGLCHASIYVHAWKLDGELIPLIKDMGIRTLQPREVFHFSENIISKQLHTVGTLNYRSKYIHEEKLDYWIGSIYSPRLLIEEIK